MTKFCNQCGKQLGEGELCNCKLAAERRLKSIPNSNPMQIEKRNSNSDKVQDNSDHENDAAEPIQSNADAAEKAEEFPPVISGVPKDFRKYRKEEEPEVENESNAYSYYKVNNKLETADLSGQAELTRESAGTKSFVTNVQEKEVMTESETVPENKESNQAEGTLEMQNNAPSEEIISAEASENASNAPLDPETYRDLVEKADPINVHNSDTKAKSVPSTPAISMYINKFIQFMIGCFKEPASYLPGFVKEGSNVKALFFIIIEALLQSTIIVILLSGVNDIISGTSADLVLLAGYSENFPLVRSFILTVVLVLVNHIVFTAVLLFVKKEADAVKFKNALCISAVRSISRIPFLLVGIVATIFFPLAGLLFIVVGSLLSIFFVNGALKEAWEKDTNRMIYKVFLVFLITILIAVIVFCFTFRLYLPERTVTRWVN